MAVSPCPKKKVTLRTPVVLSVPHAGTLKTVPCDVVTAQLQSQFCCYFVTVILLLFGIVIEMSDIQDICYETPGKAESPWSDKIRGARKWLIIPFACQFLKKKFSFMYFCLSVREDEKGSLCYSPPKDLFVKLRDRTFSKERVVEKPIMWVDMSINMTTKEGLCLCTLCQPEAMSPSSDIPVLNT